MIRKVVLRNFKRFGDVTFDIPGHLVLAGPNNTGKTTLLQAIAAWSFAFKRWKEGVRSRRRNPRAYEHQEIGRNDFTVVPVRGLDLIWTNREHRNPVQVEITDSAGWAVAMEFVWDTPEQMYVRPSATTDETHVEQAALSPIFIPATSGIQRDEPQHYPAYLELQIGQARPGDVLRNMLVHAQGIGNVWEKLCAVVQELFGYELQVPRIGAHLTVEYRPYRDGPLFEIASAGSGFQQVLTLFAFLFGRPGNVFLIDEPDAHLHVILQEVIWSRLRRVALATGAQLIIATHAETFIDAVEPDELCLCYQQPRLLRDAAERAKLTQSLRSLSNTDLMLAQSAKGVLYTEDWTDRDILRAWARVLNHPLKEALETGLLWKPQTIELRQGASGIPAKVHYEALALVNPTLPGLQLVDGDANRGLQSTEITGRGLQRLRWTRYEIESYLFHPESLSRFVRRATGTDEDAAAAEVHLEPMRRHLNDNLPPAVVREPLGDHDYLKNTKARDTLIPPILSAAGLLGLPYTRYAEIAALMLPDEIHPEVKEKLDLMQRAFGL